jgi:hypothetical protein
MNIETIKAIIERHSNFGGIALVDDVVAGATKLGVSKESITKTIVELTVADKLQMYKSHGMLKVRAL